MKKSGKPKKTKNEGPIELGETISIRPGDEEFVRLFNAGMECFGVNRSDMLTSAAKAGINQAIEDLLSKRSNGLQRFNKLYPHFNSTNNAQA